MKDDMARKGADALLRGAKMLGYACPVCKMPLYQFPSGEIRCINCDKEVKIVHNREEAEKLKKQSMMNENQKTSRKAERGKDQGLKRAGRSYQIHPSLEKAFLNLSKKATLLSEELLELQEPQEIVRRLEIIRIISEVMKSLEKV